HVCRSHGDAPRARQPLRTRSDEDAKLRALAHSTKPASSTFDDFFEPASAASQTLYASPAISTTHEGVRLDTGTPLFMRAPGLATGSVALQSAVDEFAEAFRLDPLPFPLLTYS